MNIENNNNNQAIVKNSTTSEKVNLKNKRTLTKFAASNSRKKQRTMKICLFTLITTSILIISLQTFSLNEAKIIKYLIAAPRKKLYAVPFPFPLPVFVKRQRIYTQVPVVPRYIQKPSWGTKEITESYSSQDSYPFYSSLDYQNQAKDSLSAAHSTKTSKKLNTDSKDSEKQQQSASSPSKYFAQLANAFGQSYPGLLGAASGVNALASLSSNQRDIVSKLFSGQAKIMAPTQFRYLLSGTAPKLPTLDLPSTQSLTDQQEQSPSSSDNNSTSSGGKLEPGNEESASKVYLSSLRSPPRLTSFEQYPVPSSDSYRIAAASNQLQLSPQQYANAMAARAARLRMLRPQLAAAAAAAAAASAVPDLDQQLIEQTGANQLEEAQQQADLQDPLVSSAQEYEFVASSTRPNPEQFYEALQKQQELQSDLATEKDEARIAESNSMALTAQQYGLPIVSRPIHLMNYKA